MPPMLFLSPQVHLPIFSTRIPIIPMASAIFAKLGFFKSVPNRGHTDHLHFPSQQNQERHCYTLPVLPGRIVLINGENITHHHRKATIMDSEITCLFGNANCAPIACGMALAIERVIEGADQSSPLLSCPGTTSGPNRRRTYVSCKYGVSFSHIAYRFCKVFRMDQPAGFTFRMGI